MKDISINLSDLRNVKGFGPKMEEKVLEYLDEQEKIKLFKSEYVPSDKYEMSEDINLWQGDCLELMNHIPDTSIDMILADLPYGTTACSWDEIIPFEPLWGHYKRIIKNTGVIILFGNEPFSTKLRASNLDWYRYDWKWQKEKGLGFLNAKLKPLQDTEDIMVFTPKPITVSVYNPIMREGKPYKVTNYPELQKGTNNTYKSVTTINDGERYPLTTIKYPRVRTTVHPTQKPVDLLEYLIKTYTNEGMLVLDNTMGSGSTGVACKNLNRRFIGIELDEKYFKIAKKRICECEG